MEKEQLQDRIAKKKVEIEKINKRIAKWSKGLRPEDIAVCEPFGKCIYGTAPRSMSWHDYHGTPEYQEARRNYNNYIELHKNDIPEGDDWNKGPNIGELKNAYRDLGESSYTLDKYENELKNLDKFDSEEKIEIIWNFLQDWKKDSSEYYHENAKLYGDLNKNYENAWEEYKSSVAYEDSFNQLFARYKQMYPNRNELRLKDEVDYKIKLGFRERYYEPIDKFTTEIAWWDGRVDEKKLENSLNKEIKRKYERLVQEVTEKAGEIVDASNLKINAKGEISGFIKGTKHTVELWATISGGEIQRVHIRSFCRIRETNV